MIHGGYDVFVFSLKPTYNLGAPSYGFVFLCFFCCSFSEEHVEWYRISWHIWYNWWYLSWGWRIMPTKIWKYLWHVPYSTYITYIYIYLFQDHFTVGFCWFFRNLKNIKQHTLVHWPLAHVHGNTNVHSLWIQTLSEKVLHPLTHTTPKTCQEGTWIHRFWMILRDIKIQCLVRTTNDTRGPRICTVSTAKASADFFRTE